MTLNNVQKHTAAAPTYEAAVGAFPNSESQNSNTGFSSILSQTKIFSAVATPVSIQNLLTTPVDSKEHRPNIKQFMDATGLNYKNASELVYGVIGSNTDTRNWQSIMSSGDPVNVARSATNVMYNSSAPTRVEPATVMPNHLKTLQTVAQSGNFAIMQVKNDQNIVETINLKMIASDGVVLRGAGNSVEAIQRNAWLYGFDTTPLAALATAAPLHLQKPISEVATAPAYQPAKSDLEESIDSFFSSVGANALTLLKQLEID
jgi:hypothetical protein